MQVSCSVFSETFSKAFICLHVDAIMHLYTHDLLWPEFADLASSIESKCNLLAPESGGNPFDEAYSCPWVSLASKFASFPIDLACHSATIELRGEYDVRK